MRGQKLREAASVVVVTEEQNGSNGGLAGGVGSAVRHIALVGRNRAEQAVRTHGGRPL